MGFNGLAVFYETMTELNIIEGCKMEWYGTLKQLLWRWQLMWYWTARRFGSICKPGTEFWRMGDAESNEQVQTVQPTLFSAVQRNKYAVFERRTWNDRKPSSNRLERVVNRQGLWIYTYMNIEHSSDIGLLAYLESVSVGDGIDKVAFWSWANKKMS